MFLFLLLFIFSRAGGANSRADIDFQVFQAFIKSVVKSQVLTRNQMRVGTLSLLVCSWDLNPRPQVGNFNKRWHELALKKYATNLIQTKKVRAYYNNILTKIKYY